MSTSAWRSSTSTFTQLLTWANSARSLSLSLSLPPPLPPLVCVCVCMCVCHSQCVCMCACVCERERERERENECASQRIPMPLKHELFSAGRLRPRQNNSQRAGNGPYRSTRLRRVTSSKRVQASGSRYPESES